MTEKITTYLCPILVSGLSIESQAGNLNGIEIVQRVPTSQVRAKLWPKKQIPGCKLVAGKVIAKLCNELDLFCPYDYSGASLSWKRMIRISELDYEITADSYITVFYNSPDQCHWVQSTLTIFLPHTRLLSYTIPGGYPGLIPEDKDDVFSGGGSSISWSFANNGVPGDFLQLYWIMNNSEVTSLASVAGAYYHTPAITGGEVTAIHGDYGDTTIYYTVRIQGVEKECVPSDFAEYEVGDWVYVLKTLNPDAKQCLCTNAEEMDSESPAYNNCRSPEYGSTEGQVQGDIDIKKVLSLVNAERAKYQLDPLCTNVALTKAAAGHANDMAKNDYYSHTGRDGSSSTERIKRTGYAQPEPALCATGENIARGDKDEEAVVKAWMDSPGHRANILRSDFKEMGCAVEYHERTFGSLTWQCPWWCQTFGYNPAHDSTELDVGSSEYVIVPFKINEIGPS
jgi:uncharacterized protein YkwD